MVAQQTRGRWLCAVALSYAAAWGCDRSGDAKSDAEPPAVKEDAAEAPAAPPKSARKVTVLELDALPKIPVKDLEVVDGPAFTKLPTPKPRVVYRGKNLDFPRSPWPVSPTRGFVAERKSAKPEADVERILLLNLETGEVLGEFDNLYMQYRKLGIAVAGRMGEQLRTRLLVHAEDGVTVRLWDEEPMHERRLLVNAGTGDAWVFHRDAVPEGEARQPWKYAYWGDLRKPPPEPDLPFEHEFDDGGFPKPEGWFGPSNYNPVEAPMFVQIRSRRSECAKVELRPDGYECVSSSTFAMVDGWRAFYDDERATTVIENASLGLAYAVGPERNCHVEHAALAPPRLLLQCDDHFQLLWSPSRSYAVLRDDFAFHVGRSSWNGTLLENKLERHADLRWIDLDDPALVTHPAGSQVTLWDATEHVVMIRAESRPWDLVRADLHAGTASWFGFPASRCREASSSVSRGRMAVLFCYDRSDREVERHVVDLVDRGYWPLPAVERVWLDPGRGRLYSLRKSSGSSVVESWGS